MCHVSILGISWCSVLFCIFSLASLQRQQKTKMWRSHKFRSLLQSNFRKNPPNFQGNFHLSFFLSLNQHIQVAQGNCLWYLCIFFANIHLTRRLEQRGQPAGFNKFPNALFEHKKVQQKSRFLDKSHLNKGFLELLYKHRELLFDGRNPANQLIGSLSNCLQGFIDARWFVRISSINSIYLYLGVHIFLLDSHHLQWLRITIVADDFGCNNAWDVAWCGFHGLKPRRLELNSVWFTVQAF